MFCVVFVVLGFVSYIIFNFYVLLHYTNTHSMHLGCDTNICTHKYIIHQDYLYSPSLVFFLPLPVLCGWHNAMPCLDLSHFTLSCMAQNESLPYMLLTVIIGMEIVKNPDKPKRGKTKQDKRRRGGAQTRSGPLGPLLLTFNPSMYM